MVSVGSPLGRWGRRDHRSRIVEPRCRQRVAVAVRLPLLTVQLQQTVTMAAQRQWVVVPQELFAEAWAPVLAPGVEWAPWAGTA